MFNSDAFSHINVLDKAADASYKRETIIANNIANSDTPTYKRTKQALKEIQSISTGSSQEETDTPREDISGKISFV